MVCIGNVCVTLRKMLIRVVKCGDVVGVNDVDVIFKLLKEVKELKMIGTEERSGEDNAGSGGHDNIILDEEDVMIKKHIVTSRKAFNEFLEKLMIRSRQNN